MKCKVRTPEQALAYLVDCTLATVESMAVLKRKSKYEFKRQISIAQTGINWMVDMGVPFEGTRAADVLLAGSVEEWVRGFSST